MNRRPPIFYIALAALAVLLVAIVSKRGSQPLSPGDATAPERCAGLPAAEPPSVFLAELTWLEVCAAIAAGHTTVIVPTAGLEQNGAHVVLGKHELVVRATSERIARELGDALIAPVMTYAPEGEIDPPQGHMEFAGAISLPERVFEDVLTATARSLRQHGFRLVAFVGDSGDSQDAQARVASRLSAGWGRPSVLHVADYYSANGQVAWLESQGETQANIGSHAGIRDTSEVLAAHPAGVRLERVIAHPPETSGSDGDPTRASAERGEQMLRLKVEAAVKQIRRERELASRVQ